MSDLAIKLFLETVTGAVSCVDTHTVKKNNNDTDQNNLVDINVDPTEFKHVEL